MGEVTKTPQAVQDLADHAIYLYLAEPSSDVSERFLTAAEAAFRRLTEMPGIGVPYIVPHASPACASGRFPASAATLSSTVRR